MRIQSNIAALNTSKNLAKAQTASQSSIAKLSSGYAINKAADNASGLAISEKMRGQIRGLKQASKNATDGINLISTAEGYMSTANDILQRMRELAVQSANGTYEANSSNTTSSATGDRSKINEEIQQLTDELDRLGNTAKFNGMQLSGASFSFQVGADTSGAYGANGASNLVTGNSGGSLTVQGTNTQVISVSIGSFDSKSLFVNAGNPALMTGAEKTQKLTDLNSSKTTVLANLNTAATALDGSAYAGDGTVTTAGATTSGLANALLQAFGNNKLYMDDDGDGTFGNNSDTALDYATDLASATTDDLLSYAQSLKDNGSVTIGGNTYKFKDGGTNDYATDLATPVLNVTDKIAEVNNLKGQLTSLNSQITTVSAAPVASAANPKGIDLTTQANANKSIDLIDSAISDVTAYRSRLGAVQNRLEYTIDNISTAVTNTTASEAAIRETDMVTEMMEFTKNNVMSQAATAMMAQANQQTQSVLQLLQ